jgi:hypothetical protein
VTVLPQHLQYKKGGVIVADFDELPHNVTVRIADSSDSTIQTHVACYVSSVNTATNCVASAGDMELNVLSNTGVARGVKFWLQDDPEDVLVRKVSGETVYLRRPLLRAHVNAATVEGSRATFVAGSNVANSLFWDGRAEFNVRWADANTSLVPVAIECTRYPMTRTATAQDMIDLEPDLYHILSAYEDIERALDDAHEFVLMEIAKAAPDMRARVFTGSVEFARVTALAAAYLRYATKPGAVATEQADKFKGLFDQYLAGVVLTTPRDANQDKVIEGNERMSSRTVRIYRS